MLCMRGTWCSMAVGNLGGEGVVSRVVTGRMFFGFGMVLMY